MEAVRSRGLELRGDRSGVAPGRAAPLPEDGGLATFGRGQCLHSPPQELDPVVTFPPGHLLLTVVRSHPGNPIVISVSSWNSWPGQGRNNSGSASRIGCGIRTRTRWRVTCRSWVGGWRSPPAAPGGPGMDRAPDEVLGVPWGPLTAMMDFTSAALVISAEVVVSVLWARSAASSAEVTSRWVIRPLARREVVGREVVTLGEHHQGSRWGCGGGLDLPAAPCVLALVLDIPIRGRRWQ